MRWYVGYARYKVETVGIADDIGDADGVAVLDFMQARALIRGRYVKRLRVARGLAGGDEVSTARCDASVERVAYKERNRIADHRTKARTKLKAIAEGREVRPFTAHHLSVIFDHELRFLEAKAAERLTPLSEAERERLRSNISRFILPVLSAEDFNALVAFRG